MRPSNLLVYYGWPSAFNSAVNGWDLGKVAQDMARYQLVVLGDGLQEPSHGDHANTVTIVSRILALNPSCTVFGYLDTAQSISSFENKVDQWQAVGVNGIFMDRAGYDFGSPSTNKRKIFNDKVDYVHGLNMKVFANAWNPDHVLGTENDPSYPNSVWNQPLRETKLTASDWYLAESFSYGPYGPSGELQYEDALQWKNRGDKISGYFGAVQVAAVAQIDENDPAIQAKSDFVQISSTMWGMNACGTSDIFHGAGSAKVTMWPRPDTVNMHGEINGGIGQDGLKYVQYLAHGKLEVDFSPGAESSAIDKY